MKITMTADYDWPVPNSRSWIAFKAGWAGRVTRAQGAAIIAAGVGYEVSTPRTRTTRNLAGQP